MKPSLLAVAFCLPAVCGATFSSAAHAQASPSPYTSATRYDAMGRVTGTISPDPDGSGSLKFLAVRNTYNAAGFLIKVETGELSAWQSEALAPASWSGFTVLTILEMTYDALGRKTRELVRGSDNAAVSITEYSYDSVGRLECTAQRMNTAVWGTPLANKCVPGTAGSHGPDRITRQVYDAAGQLLQVREGVGSTVEAADVTYTYTNNGKIKFVIDANGNKAELRYDGHDRQVRWVFPSTTKPSAFNDTTPANAVATAGALNESDYELYGYDANGNRTSLRKRDGSTLTYQFDALNRMTVKVVPGSTTHTRDVYYGYDLRGLQTYARFDSTSGQGVTQVWDGFGRLTSATVNLDGQSRQLSHLYDKDGNRTRITHPDAAYFTYTYDGLDRLYEVRRPDTAIIARNAYNERGLLKQTIQHNSSNYAYDAAGRLNSIIAYFSGGGASVTYQFTHNPASQLLTETRSNDLYAWTGHANVNRGYTTNGLNQYSAAGSAAFCYDANGNLTADGTSVYKYDVENRLIEKRAQTNSTCSSLSYSGTLQATLRYDPLGRLYELGGSGGAIVARFLHDGDALVGEYNSSGTLLRRYVHGADAGADDPLAWFEGSGLTDAAERLLRRDRQGSIIALGQRTGNPFAINTYDEYGIPGSANQGRFQYTGQAWLAELGMYYYKARIYSPTLGRFLQTDPIGYDDQFNLYAYVANDPLNRSDPTGNEAACVTLNTGCGMDGFKAPTVDDVVNVVTAVLVVVDVLDGPQPDVGAAALAGRAARAEAGEAAAAARAGKVGPGPYAKDSIPAGPSARPNAAQQRQINEMGQANGCHTCGTKNPGTKSGNFVGDHQPPTKLNPSGGQQQYHPQCQNCSNVQGGRVSQLPPPPPPPPPKPWWKFW